MGSSSPSQLLLPWISRHRAVSCPSERPDFSAREPRSMSPTTEVGGSVVVAEATWLERPRRCCSSHLEPAPFSAALMSHRRPVGGCCWKTTVGRWRLTGRVGQEEMPAIDSVCLLQQISGNYTVRLAKLLVACSR
uniref:Uncharacterized protein n=1 Tax=Arundo donax TaxID=35708 RepID=A0A0A9GXP6_ARUDO